MNWSVFRLVSLRWRFAEFDLCSLYTQKSASSQQSSSTRKSLPCCALENISISLYDYWAVGLSQRIQIGNCSNERIQIHTPISSRRSREVAKTSVLVAKYTDQTRAVASMFKHIFSWSIANLRVQFFVYRSRSERPSVSQQTTRTRASKPTNLLQWTLNYESRT